MMIDSKSHNLVHGFLPGERVKVKPSRKGSLSGKTFSVKDLIDIAGTKTGGGNPDWYEHATDAQQHAPVVSKLLHEGAACVGKTITDELAFSLEGNNAHYGIPTNPRDKNWLPGGSSSGSAVSVASGSVDFSLGTDTGGSVRVPAAFCGIFGFRPSHGKIDMRGVLPFAPTYDTLGWFANDAELLEAVGNVLLPHSQKKPEKVTRIVVAKDVLEQVSPDVAGDIFTHAACFEPCEHINILNGQTLQHYQQVYSICQGYEIKMALGAKLRQLKPRFAPNIKERFAGALAIDKDSFEAAKKERGRLALAIEEHMQPGIAIILPVSCERFLLKQSSTSTIGTFYGKTLGLTAIGGNAGLPQVQLGSIGTTDALGLSLLGARGSDLELLALANQISKMG